MTNKLILISFAVMSILALVLSGCGTEHTLSVIEQGQGVVIPESGGTHKSGTIVELTATPAAGYAFDHWDGPDGASVKATK